MEWDVFMQGSATIFAKSARNVWNGIFISNSLHEKVCRVTQMSVEWGVKSEMKVHTIWVFQIFIFDHATSLFG